jgi:hypothetical protein
LWRAELADRKVLIVLDDAVSAAQIHPLLPGTIGSVALITSRHRLAELETTLTLSLDVMPSEDAIALFTSVVGDDRAMRGAVFLAETVRLCGYLPLAIRIVATRLRTRLAWTVEDLLSRLRQQNGRLTELAIGDRGVAAAFALSYRRLSPDQQRLFRLLGLVPGPRLRQSRCRRADRWRRSRDRPARRAVHGGRSTSAANNQGITISRVAGRLSPAPTPRRCGLSRTSHSAMALGRIRTVEQEAAGTIR